MRLVRRVTVAVIMASGASARWLSKHTAARSPIGSSPRALHTSVSSSAEYDLPS
jgi:hypothetical protein